MKNELHQSPDSLSHNIRLSYEAIKDKLSFDFSNKLNYSKNKFSFFNPNISLLSKQIHPFIITASYNQGLNFGLTRDIKQNGNFGY